MPGKPDLLETKAKIGAAYDYLHAWWFREKRFYTNITTDSVKLTNSRSADIFVNVVILELLQNSKLDNDVKISITNLIKSSFSEDGLFAFFPCHKSQLPPDVDVTSLCLTNLTNNSAIDDLLGKNIVHRIVKNVSKEGVIRVWFSEKECFRELMDHVVCANALFSIHQYRLASQAKKTEDYIHHILETGKFLEGSLYYPSPDTFLLSLARLMTAFPALRLRFESSVRKNLVDRIESTDNILDLSMRIMIARAVSISNDPEAEKLIHLQETNGSWKEECFYTGHLSRHFHLRRYFGSPELSTAFAIRALECYSAHSYT